MDYIAIPLTDISRLERDSQIEAMREWFSKRYEDPAERTPYDSREGGYQWIWGGPLDAREELGGHFGEHVDDDILNELVEELEHESFQWVPAPKPEDYEDYDEHFVDDVSEIEDCHNEFRSALATIQSLLEITPRNEAEGKLCALLYVNVITSLEAYLSDKFIKRVMNDGEVLRLCVESSPAFAKEKIPVSDVLKVAESIKTRTKTYLADIVWHNLGRIKQMYAKTLKVDLGDIAPIMSAVTKRHDLVHRNGRDKDGDVVSVGTNDVEQLIANANVLVNNIESQLAKCSGSGEDGYF